MMLARGDLLSLQDLCFQEVHVAFLPLLPFWQEVHQDCIDLGFLILSEGCLFFSSLFLKTPKRKKKSIPERINFLIKKSLKNHTFGSSERLPPLSGAVPTNKNTHPPIRKPPPSQANFFLGCLFAIAFLFARTTSRFKIALT